MTDTGVGLDNRIRELGLRHGLADVVGVRQVGLVHLHEVDAHEEGLAGLRRAVEIVDRGLLDVLVEERDADHALLGRVLVFAVDVPIVVAFSPALPDSAPVVTFWNMARSSGLMLGVPLRIAVGVGVEVVQQRVLHLVIALRVGQRVVRLAQVPLAREEGLVAPLLEHRRQRPLGCRQPAALALERHGGHAAAVRDAPGLHRRPPGSAAGLTVEREEAHAFVRQAVEIGCRHAAPDTTAVDARITVTEVVGRDQDDVGFRGLCEGRARDSGQPDAHDGSQYDGKFSASIHCVFP